MPSSFVWLSCILLATTLFSQSCSSPEKPATEASSNEEETTENPLPAYEYDRTPLRVGVVGLVHTHVHWILGREKAGDIEIVGIVEPNRELAQQYSEQHGYSVDIVYPTMEEMVAATQPEAVTAFNLSLIHI